MDQLNSDDRIRQQRFWENLRWYLRNQAVLELRAEQDDFEAQTLIEVFEEVTGTLAAGKIDVFNAVAERYQKTSTALTNWPSPTVGVESLQDVVDQSNS